jgi:hypothetical protein
MYLLSVFRAIRQKMAGFVDLGTFAIEYKKCLRVQEPQTAEDILTICCRYKYTTDMSTNAAQASSVQGGQIYDETHLP